MKFQDMPYSRPDLEALQTKTAALIERLKGAKSFEEAEAAFLEMDRESGHVNTLCTLASIRHQIDTRDAFYDGENDFVDAAGPLIQECGQRWARALLETPFRPQFEEKYGRLLFLNTEIALKTFSPEIMEDLQEENALCSAYEKLIASAQIPFEGGTYTLSQLSPFKQDPSDARRLAAWTAEGRFYQENQAKLDEIYDRMVALRDKMAKQLGYKDFVTLGYYRMNRNCYDRQDVEKFRRAVVKYLVPLADGIYRRQAARLGLAYPLNFADMALEFRSGNARPKGSPADILAQGRKFYHELSPETAAFIDRMYADELLDVLSRTGKAAGGFCTSLPDYKVPFIFANFNGTQGDVEVITHEAGHAFAGYMARDIVPEELQWPTMESCEIHSMSMEFFAWPWAQGFFGEDTDKFYYGHLSGALTFIPYGAMVDDFQHQVYERPEMTPEERHGVWKKLLGIYMPWVKLGEIPFYGEGHGWQRQTHIYECPFYYIDYCLAQTVALQFWAEMQKDRAGAWAAYMRLVRLAGTGSFTELVQAAGLASPFGDGALSQVCAAAQAFLEHFDMEKVK